MPREKKSNAFGVRLDPQLAARVAAVEKATGFSRGELVRQALDAVCDCFEKAGTIAFPITIVTEAELSAYKAKLGGEIADKILAEEKDSILTIAIGKLQEMFQDRLDEMIKLGMVQPAELYEPDDEEAAAAEKALEEAQKSNIHYVDFQGGIAAGSPISGHVNEEPIPVGKEYPDDHYALKVFGKSMEPKIPDGSTIIVRRFQDQGFPRQGTIVVYNDGHGATLKELGYRKAKPGEEANNFGKVPVLKSLNPAFPEIQTMEGGRIDAIFVEVL